MIEEPEIEVGIVRSSKICFVLHTTYRNASGQRFMAGEHVASGTTLGVCIDGIRVSDCELCPQQPNSTFSVKDVEIGVGFHWDQKEDQSFAGKLRFVVDGDGIWAVNKIKVEDYLRSVIASEMSATSDIELLKAHAVASRSWLMAQVWNKGKFVGAGRRNLDGEKKYICWRDREDHKLFDVCADDHCQRYQGVGRISQTAVDKAIAQTRGEILTYEGNVCDARFSKCCGGMTEVFSTCWTDDEVSYLRSFADSTVWPSKYHDLQNEQEAREWIYDTPEAFCNTQDAKVIGQILNSYDQKTQDFYRWRIEYGAEELGSIIKEKCGIDIGEVVDLVPLQRGPSGRIKLLRIVGSKDELTVGKELEIRRLLSRTHLYSSAFSISWKDKKTIVLSGAGWGHGVGMCQIGAAVMANRGFNYRSILYHYFRRAMIEKKWV